MSNQKGHTINITSCNTCRCTVPQLCKFERWQKAAAGKRSLSAPWDYTTCIFISVFMPSSQGHAVTFRRSGDVSRIADDTVLHTSPLKVSLFSSRSTHYSTFFSSSLLISDVTSLWRCAAKRRLVCVFFLPPFMPAKVRPVKIKPLSAYISLIG